MPRGGASNPLISSGAGSGGRPGLLGTGEVFLGREVPAASLSRAESGGRVRRLSRGLYTTNTTDPLEDVTRRNHRRIVGLLFPDAVFSDRSALSGGEPDGDGNLFLVSPAVGERGRTVSLPGRTLYVRRGPGGAEGDAPLPGGIHLAGTARGLLENAQVTRSRGNRPSPTLARRELEEWIERLLDQRGEEGLKRLRDEARNLSVPLALEDEFRVVDSLIGAVLGTRRVKAESPLLRARLRGLPYDERRVELFKALRDELAALAPRLRPSSPEAERVHFLPFFDAYFSNFIEGTDFTVDEAREIVFENVVPTTRPADAHDILGTYATVASVNEMRRLPQSFTDYVDILRTRHYRMLERRPEVAPGVFKQRPNRSGSTLFVDPGRVEGTLAQGFDLYTTLDDPFARAVYQAFLVAEVHPFNDGNGRISRIMMNAELVAADEARIIIPPVYRIEYLGALRALSNNAFADRLARVLDFAQRYTHAIDFTDFDGSVEQLDRTNAFVDSDVAERESIKLRIPTAADE